MQRFRQALLPRCSRQLNPLTAMSAAPSIGERPPNVQNLQALRLSPPPPPRPPPSRPRPPFAWARERISTQMHNIESRFAIGLATILFAGVYVCALFSPGNFTGWGSEEVNSLTRARRQRKVVGLGSNPGLTILTYILGRKKSTKHTTTRMKMLQLSVTTSASASYIIFRLFCITGSVLLS